MNTSALLKVDKNKVSLYLKRPENPDGYKVCTVPLNKRIRIVKTEYPAEPRFTFGFEEDDGTIPD